MHLTIPIGQLRSMHTSMTADAPTHGRPSYHGPLHTRVRDRVPKTNPHKVKDKLQEQSAKYGKLRTQQLFHCTVLLTHEFFFKDLKSSELR